MGDQIKGSHLDALRRHVTDARISRRATLQAIPMLTMASTLSGAAFASGIADDPSSRVSRRLHIDQQFVLFPVNNDAMPRRVRLVENGRVLRSFTASLGLPAHWWTHLDVSDWRGEVLALSIEPDNTPPAPGKEMSSRGAAETNNGELIAAVRTSAEIWSPETVYKEPLRPLIHFSAKRGWINDPNGLMYHNGQYHMFFQHNPYGIRWANMHWGHAVSTDLVHWKELPVSLYPRGEKDEPYSGAGVVDHDNTSGWGRNGRPPMVIAFTSSGRGECIAYSNDDGAMWTEFDGNPVVRHNGRDPKLLWHAPTKQWVMAVYSERPGADAKAPKRQGIAFFTSPDLKAWQERSWIEGYFECPDLFELPVDGDTARLKWVLSCALGHYAIGEFDGSRFVPETPRLPGPRGGGRSIRGATVDPSPAARIHAAQTFSDHPKGHIVQVAWGMLEEVQAPSTHMMTFPTTLSLRTTSEGVRLCREPVDTIRSLRVRTYDIPTGQLTSSPLLTELRAEAWDIEAVIRVGALAPVILSLGGDDYVYWPGSQMLGGPSGSLPIPLDDGRLRLRILVDRATVEIFGDRGQAYGLFVRRKAGGDAALSLRTWPSLSEHMPVETLRVHELRSAWAT